MRAVPRLAVATVVLALLTAVTANVVGEFAGVLFVVALTVAAVLSHRVAWTVGVLVLAVPAAAVDLRLWDALPSRTTATAVAVAHASLMLAIYAIARVTERRAEPPLIVGLSLPALLAAVTVTGAAGTFTWPLVCAWTVAAALQLAADRGRTARRAAVPLAVAALLLAPFVAQAIPDRSQTPESRAGGGSTDADLAPTYGGFSEELDTADRFDRSDTPVMRVRAQESDFWRGQSFDVWDGRRWTQSATGAVRLPQYEGTAYVLAAPGDSDAGEEFVQTFTLLASGVDTVFGAYRPGTIEVPIGEVAQHPDGSLQWSEPMAAGTVYSVVSSRRPVTADDLREDDPPRSQRDRDRALAARYTQLPDVPARVVDFAEQAIAASSARTASHVVGASAIAAQTEYTLDIPPLPPGADAVEQFLFVDRQGYCEQIATALAVMLRTQGIPARVATGFTPGARDPFGGDFLVRQSDAHAWVEVWFPTNGWQAFDPTARVPLAGEEDRDVTDLLAALAYWMVPVVAIAVLLGVVVVVRRRRSRLATPWAVGALDRFDRAARQHDVARASSETLDAHAARAGPVDDRLSTVALLVSRDAYGPGLTDDERAEADRLLAQLARASRWRRLARRWSHRSPDGGAE
jgi:transglutaminase-like putative cysteine protease